jgi:hypothetical protein
MHKSILEYASTASILKPFEKKFLKKWSSPRISSKPLLKRRSKKKRGRKRKAPKVSSNKRKANILRGERHFNIKKILFDVIPFSPLHHTISKTLSKIIEKAFLTLFGPFFSLEIYMTWVVPFLLAHELHVFSLWRIRWEGTTVEPRWGTTYQKECMSV